VLRNVVVDDRPRLLARPGAGRPGGRQPAAGSAIAQEGSGGAYEDGYRAGVSAGEAAMRDKYEATLENGYREAFEQGLVDGRQQGLTEGREAGRQVVEREARAAREERAARLTQLEKLLVALPAEMERRLASADEEMVALCHGVICRLLGDTLVTREGIAHRVRQALREAGGHSGNGRSAAKQLAVHLHPRDLAELERDEVVSAWMRQEASTQGVVRWVADAQVDPGGCVVHSGEGNLDARLDTQMTALRQLLLRRDPGGEEPIESAAASNLLVQSGGSPPPVGAAQA
jgi:flagellar assembly protein FliH